MDRKETKEENRAGRGIKEGMERKEESKEREQGEKGKRACVN